VPDVVGIDVGLTHFATLSTGEKINNPRFFRQQEKALAKAQRRLSKGPKRGPRRRKRRKAVARVHERTAWRRNDFVHQQSRKIVDRFQVIAVEALRVKRMLHIHCLAKSIMDAAWRAFLETMRVKAEWAGRSFVAVNPAYTTQDCSRCAHRQKKSLSERTHHCDRCGLVLDRDHNSALRVLGLGLNSLGLIPECPPLSVWEQSQLVLLEDELVGDDGPGARSLIHVKMRARQRETAAPGVSQPRRRRRTRKRSAC
jgi:putative transposase